MELLLEAIEERQKQKELHHQQLAEKNKRRNRKRPRSLKEKILKYKKKHSEIKKIRRKNISSLVEWVRNFFTIDVIPAKAGI